MSEKTITLEQAKLWRFICRLAFTLVAFVTPVIITGLKFQMFTAYTHTKISIVGVLVLLVIGWRFKKRIGEWITTWEDSNIFKHILLGIGKVWPFILVVIILGLIHWSASQLIGDVLFCLEWTCVCELVSYLIIYPFEMRFDYLVKRMIRKNERKADYKEAIKEMKAEEGE